MGATLAMLDQHKLARIKGVIMSHFTTKTVQPSTVITLEEDLVGRVDIIASTGDKQTWRIAAIGDGKLHLFKLNRMAAEKLGIDLDAEGYPLICRSDLPDHY